MYPEGAKCTLWFSSRHLLLSQEPKLVHWIFSWTLFSTRIRKPHSSLSSCRSRDDMTPSSRGQRSGKSMMSTTSMYLSVTTESLTCRPKRSRTFRRVIIILPQHMRNVRVLGWYMSIREWTNLALTLTWEMFESYPNLDIST